MNISKHCVNVFLQIYHSSVKAQVLSRLIHMYVSFKNRDFRDLHELYRARNTTVPFSISYDIYRFSFQKCTHVQAKNLLMISSVEKL